MAMISFVPLFLPFHLSILSHNFLPLDPSFCPFLPELLGWAQFFCGVALQVAFWYQDKHDTNLAHAKAASVSGETKDCKHQPACDAGCINLHIIFRWSCLKFTFYRAIAIGWFNLIQCSFLYGIIKIIVSQNIYNQSIIQICHLWVRKQEAGSLAE